MDGEKRREQIMQLLIKSNLPISGTELARTLSVSRQIIVQDVALLRAVNKNILSTNKGYVLFSDNKETNTCKRNIMVCHKQEDILDELFTIVDMGGKVRDVVVEHPIYGQIMVDLIINNRVDAEKFMEQVNENQAKPLNNLTRGVHYHTIIAESEEVLDAIEKELIKKGYLIN